MSNYRQRMGLVVLSILFVTTATAVAQLGLDTSRIPKGFISGRDWQGLTKTEQQLYAIGVVDGLDLASRTTEPRMSLSWINQCVAGMSASQVRLWLKKELETTPDEGPRLMVHWAMYRALDKNCDKGP